MRLYLNPFAKVFIKLVKGLLISLFISSLGVLVQIIDLLFAGIWS